MSKEPTPNPCRFCRKDIEVGALVCDKCGRSQKWGNLQPVGTVLSLLVAAIAVFTFAATSWKSAFDPPRAEILVTVPAEDASLNEILFDVVNLSDLLAQTPRLVDCWVSEKDLRWPNRSDGSPGGPANPSDRIQRVFEAVQQIDDNWLSYFSFHPKAGTAPALRNSAAELHFILADDNGARDATVGVHGRMRCTLDFQDREDQISIPALFAFQIVNEGLLFHHLNHLRPQDRNDDPSRDVGILFGARAALGLTN